MHLDWLDSTALDSRDVDGATAVLEMARATDCPHVRPYDARLVRADLEYGWDLEPAQAALARNRRGRVVGVLTVRSSSYDNRHVADIDVTVDPSDRRRGLGRRLFEAGVERATADGRTLVIASTWDGTPGVGFAKAMGLDRASEEVRRDQDLWGTDPDRLEALAAEAARSHADYEIVPVGYPTPDELLDDVCRLTASMNDAPTDDLDVEDEVFTPQRIRAFERAQSAHDRRMYRMIARHRGTGELAGHTIVTVDALQPWRAAQLDTSVLREHRGRRLGLALKIAMLRLLAAREPQARLIETWNAASNDHMIAVNAALGYRVVGRMIGWQKHL